MEKNSIKNWGEIATTKNRELALSIASAGISAINTRNVVSNSVKLQGEILSIQGKQFDLSKYKEIKVVGFGKSSIEAAIALEEILGERIKRGAVIGLEPIATKYIETFGGTHPIPEEKNAIAGKKISELLKNSNEDDLIIVLASGGGSALLCANEEECEQGAKLYKSFLGSGKTIVEINTIRKHLSSLKGGGLAQIAFPATVIGMIFSDVPGEHFENVASGPTYRDQSTVADAQKIISDNSLGDFKLTETPKDDKYFEKVHNFVLVSNMTAIQAMVERGRELGLDIKIISTELYDEMGAALEKIFSVKETGTLVLAAGEPSIEVTGTPGRGGRNSHMALKALSMNLVDENSVFISLASDGLDNSDSAGAVVDSLVQVKAKNLGLDAQDYLNRFDSYTFFQQTGDLIITGPTGANVSDLMILLSKK